MTRRFIIRDIETKKTNYLNHRKMEFNSLQSAKDLLCWFPFNLGYYYEVYDTENEEIAFSYENIIKKRSRW